MIPPLCVSNLDKKITFFKGHIILFIFTNFLSYIIYYFNIFHSYSHRAIGSVIKSCSHVKARHDTKRHESDTARHAYLSVPARHVSRIVFLNVAWLIFFIFDTARHARLRGPNTARHDTKHDTSTTRHDTCKHDTNRHEHARYGTDRHGRIWF
jgi:hypothetical protein